jgi:hypothetical protein
LILSFNGTNYSAPGRCEKYAFKNIPWGGNDYFVLIQAGTSGADTDKLTGDGYLYSIMGQRISPSLTPAWSARIGKTYIIDNIGFNEWGWGSAFFAFSTKDGLLLGGRAGATTVLLPQNNTLAYAAGILNRGDSSVRIESIPGGERVTMGGYSGYDIGLVPSLNIGDSVSGSLDFHQTRWYKLTITTAGQNISVTTSGTNPQYTLALFDADLTAPVEGGNGSFAWTSVPGTYYLAITPAPSDASAYTLSVKAL